MPSPSPFASLIEGHAVLERALRLTGQPDRLVFVETGLGQPSRGAVHCTNGTRLELQTGRAGAYLLHTSTIDDGRIVPSVHCYVNGQGQQQGTGTYNAFGLGQRLFRDQVYLDELWTELTASVQDAGGPAAYWDTRTPSTAGQPG